MGALHSSPIKNIFYDKIDLRLFYFLVMICHQKKKEKNNENTDRLYIYVFVNPQYQCAAGAQPPISNCPPFFKEYLYPTTPRSGSTKWQTSCQFPPYSFNVNLRDTPSRILIAPLGLCLSSEFCLIFSRRCATIVGKNFQITGKCICESKKLKEDIFTLALLGKTLLQVIFTRLGRGKLLNPPRLLENLFPPSRKGEGNYDLAISRNVQKQDNTQILDQHFYSTKIFISNG